MNETSRSNPKRRRQFESQQIQQWIQEYHESSLTQKQFALQIGVGLSTFTKWIYRRARAQSPTAPKPWIEVKASKPTNGPIQSPSYRIEFTDGSRLDFSSNYAPKELEHLIGLLRCSA